MRKIHYSFSKQAVWQCSRAIFSHLDGEIVTALLSAVLMKCLRDWKLDHCAGKDINEKRGRE